MSGEAPREAAGRRRFVDTNLFVYAHDESAGRKREVSRALIEETWEFRSGCVSVQVLQELFVSLTRKIRKPLPADEAGRIIADLSRWEVHAPLPDDVLGAIDLHRRAGVSFWDAMILTSAAALGASTLFSEDLNPGQTYDGVTVLNPLEQPDDA